MEKELNKTELAKNIFWTVLQWSKVNIKPKYIVMAIAGLGLIATNVGNMKAPESINAISNPTDRRNLPDFNVDQNELAERTATIAAEKNKLWAVLENEEQRGDIAVANLYISLATLFQNTPNHPCNGKTTSECLKTFEANRIADIQTSTQPVDNPTNDLTTNVNYFLSQTSQIQKLRALYLAIIISTPSELRSQQERELISTRYPILNQGIGVSDLKPRSWLVLEQVNKIRTELSRLDSQSSEVQQRSEYCLSLTPDQQREANCPQSLTHP